MLDKKEIYVAFNTLGLASESERQRILSQGVVQSKIERKTISYIVVDNVTTLNKEEESRDAKLE
ncbi:hypothetical protein ES703_18312 [subsurface metagenome]